MKSINQLQHGLWISLLVVVCAMSLSACGKKGNLQPPPAKAIDAQNK
jgi:predicted small lipoprotein YifL